MWQRRVEKVAVQYIHIYVVSNLRVPILVFTEKLACVVSTVLYNKYIISIYCHTILCLPHHFYCFNFQCVCCFVMLEGIP